METELKQAIINFIFENQKLFNINNVATEKFRLYIYDNEGNYLIGGQDVSVFIGKAIKLITE